MADYYQTSHDAQQTTNAADWQDAEELAFDGEGVDWVTLFSAEFQIYCQATIDGVTYGEGEQLGNGYSPFGVAVKVGLASGTRSLKIQWKKGGAGGSGVVQKIRIIAVRATALPNVYSLYDAAAATTSSTTTVTVSTLTVSVLAEDYLFLASYHIAVTPVDANHYTANSKIVQDTTITLANAGVNNVDSGVNTFSRVYQNTTIKRVTLTSGTHTFIMQHYASNAPATSTIQYRSMLLIQMGNLIYSYSEAENEVGVGTVGTLILPNPTLGVFLIIAYGEGKAPGLDDYWNLTVDSVVEGAVNGEGNVVYEPLCALKVGAYEVSDVATLTAVSDLATRYNRLFALDLSFISADEYVPTPHECLADPFDVPQITAEIMPKNDYSLGGLLEVVSGRVTLNAGASIDDFVVQVRDDDGSIMRKLTMWDPIWIWITAQSVTKRFWFRIEEIDQIFDYELGNLTEISGRHWGSYICYRGRETDVTKTNREIADIIINPTDGLMTLATEVPSNLYVSSAGVTLPSYLEKRGRKVIDMLTELSMFASQTYDYRWLLSHGEFLEEWGKPGLHFERPNQKFSQGEIVLNDQVYFDSIQDSREVMNSYIEEYGSWGAETDATESDVSSQAEGWGISPKYDRRVDLSSSQANTIADVSIRGLKQPKRATISKLMWSHQYTPNQRCLTWMPDSMTPRATNISQVIYEKLWQQALSGERYDEYTMSVILGGLMEEYTEHDLELHASATRTTSGVGTAYDASAFYGGVAVSNVTAASGTTPKLDVHIEAGDDTYTVLLLPMNGADAGTTFENSAVNKRTVTAVNHAQTDTSYWYFGGASGEFDGTDDSLTLVDNDDWSFGSGDFTIDFWMRPHVITNAQVFCGQYADANNYWYINKSSNATGNKLGLKFVTNGVTVADYIMTSNSSLAASTWYHLAFMRLGSLVYVFINGVAQNLTENTPISNKDVGDVSAVLDIGKSNASNFFDGWFDEFRISKGVARYPVGVYTVPTVQYSFVTPVLLLRMDDADAGTSFTDHGIHGWTVTKRNHAQIDTAQSKFGGSSGLFDGTDDSVDIPDCDDWNLADEDFTLDFWAMINTLPTSGQTQTVVAQYVDANNLTSLSLLNVSGLYFWKFLGRYAGNDVINAMALTSVATSTWYHIAVTRFSDVWNIYQDGVQLEVI